MSEINYKTILGSLIIFFIGYIIEYCLNAFVASHISPALFGDFSLALKFMLLAGPLYLIGMPSSIVKYVSKYQSSGDNVSILKFLGWSIKKSFKVELILIPFFIILLIFIFFLDHYQFHLLEHQHAAIYFQLFTPFISAALLLSSLLLAFRKILSSNIAEQLLRNIIFIICFSLLFLIMDSKSIHGFHLALCVGIGSLLWLIVVTLVTLYNKNIGSQFKRLLSNEVPQPQESSVSEWGSYGRKICINTSIYTLVSFLDLLIIEIIPHYGDHNVGYYAACLTISSLIFITKKGIFQVLKPYMATAQNSNSTQLVVNKAFKLFVGAILFQCIIIIVLAKVLLSFFGPSFFGSAFVLRILTIGYTVSMFPSLSVFYLLFNGFEKVLLKSSYCILLATLVFGSLAYYLFGLIGIAIAISLIINFQSYILFFFVKKKTNIKFMIVI